MSYDFTHWCSQRISFFLWPARTSSGTIYVSELQSPRDLHCILIKLYHCSFAIKTPHKIHFWAIIIVLVHDVWNPPVRPCHCGVSGVRVWHLPGYVIVSSSVILTRELYHIHNIRQDEGNIKVRPWGILVIIGVMINSTKSLEPGSCASLICSNLL
jgi:hypothetical protein